MQISYVGSKPVNKKFSYTRKGKTMKKFFAILLCVVMVLAIVACNTNNETETGSETEKVTEKAPETTKAPQVEEEEKKNSLVQAGKGEG